MQVYGVVARDAEGRIVGSNFLDQRGEVASVGTVLRVGKPRLCR